MLDAWGEPPEKLKSCNDDRVESSTSGGDAEQREVVEAGGRNVVAEGSARKHLDVENSGRGRACKNMAHIACTRSTETIRMQNKEEICVVVVGCD